MHQAFRTGAVAAAALLAVAGPAPLAAAADTAPRQWYLDKMAADAMWKVGTGKGIKVAVIGTGVNPDTPSLRGQVLPGVDTLVADDLVKGSLTDTHDTTGAGTTAAELIAGTGKGGGLKGLAPGVKIIPIRVPAIRHDELPDPNYPLETAIRAAVDHGAQIIDITVGNQYPIGTQLWGYGTLDRAVKKDVLMFAGVGDNAKAGNKPQYPAAYDQVVGVGAMDRTGTVTPTSQHGDDVDIAGPGVDIPRWCDATFRRYCADGGGTAAASAIVSASAALVWSEHPDWTAAQVWRVLEDTAGRSWPADTPSVYLGYGVVRPRQVLVLGRGRPGAPDAHTSPYDVVPPKGSPTASPAPSPSGGASRPGGKSTGPVSAAATDSSDGSGAPLGPIALVATGVVILAATATWAVRRRRTR
ncbi:serine protease [Streptomyces yokosukanensis]|uniref:Serine protease n=1 Tax=Streptomyces yokosukanensis TaxID=67386 RepID=A0A117Q546_9ACTN|nr:S8 family serine peptidase [Streptomyces yokosukanensis]KUN08862.1 serine protease [Streptomyces yokosukanensis]